MVEHRGSERERARGSHALEAANVLRASRSIAVRVTLRAIRREAAGFRVGG